MGIRLGVTDTVSPEHSRDRVGTMSEVSMSGAGQDREPTVEELKQELAEARDHQTAAGEILHIISGSPTDAQPTLVAIAECATRLCDAVNSLVFRYDGELLHLAAHHNVIAERLEAVRRVFPRRADIGSVAGRVLMSRAVTHVEDITVDPDYALPLATTVGYRSVLGVPMLRGGAPIGAIIVARGHVAPFSNRQIRLLETFADQAVIAMENARQFEEAQARTRELTEALEQQTATSEVLSVISTSPGELEPVFQTMLANATRLCEGSYGNMWVREEKGFRQAAFNGQLPPEFTDRWRSAVISPASNVPLARAAQSRKPVHIADLRKDPTYLEGHPLALSADSAGIRTLVAVPMLKENDCIGVIAIYRKELRPFGNKQVELLTSFAAQAVIAIENTRLLNELRESLEYQTATSGVLNVIGSSATDAQPVFDAIVKSAAHLFEPCAASMIIRENGLLRWKSSAASHREGEVRAQTSSIYPVPFDPMTSPSSRAIATRTVVEIPDALALDAPGLATRAARVGGFRSITYVPLVRGDEGVGVLILTHSAAGFKLTGKQLALAQTFADQAVIAIENARLFEELQARNRDLTALGEVGRAVSSTLDLKMVLKSIVERAVDLSGTDAGSIFYFRSETSRFELGETAGLDQETVSRFRKLDIAAGQTGMGEAIVRREPLQIPDVVKRPSNALRDAALAAGLHAALIVPLLGGSEGSLGALVLQRRRTGEFTPSVVSLMQSFADQSAIALENARLFEEIAQKSQELEVASQHKSQFVANMSHELRTPLAAMLGYAELIQEGFYGPLPDKALDSLSRIRSNGRHLLGLINTVLDIAKIESGQFTLNVTEYAIESVVETVRSATESLAQNKKLRLTTDVAKSMPVGLGDEQRLTQVLLNLVGNAIKFTDAGEVRVTAKTVNGRFNVSVVDTGPGIPDRERTRIFDLFHQVDSSLTNAKGGTGLGLAIAKQIVEMHGGRIWVESILGKGSTFQMEIPTRTEFQKRAL